jgi:hypothetical protein
MNVEELSAPLFRALAIFLAATLAACAPATPPLGPPVRASVIATGDGPALGFHRMEPAGGAGGVLIVVTATGATTLDPDGEVLDEVSVPGPVVGSTVVGRTLVLSESNTGNRLSLWSDALEPTGLAVIDLPTPCHGLYVVRGDDVGCWSSGPDLAPLVIDLSTGERAPDSGVPMAMAAGVTGPSYAVPGRDAVVVGAGPFYWANLAAPSVELDVEGDGALSLGGPLALVGAGAGAVVVGRDAQAYRFERCLDGLEAGAACREPLGAFFELRDGMELIATAPPRPDALYAVESLPFSLETMRAIHADAAGRVLAHTAFGPLSLDSIHRVIQVAPERGVVYLLTHDVVLGALWAVRELPLP